MRRLVQLLAFCFVGAVSIGQTIPPWFPKAPPLPPPSGEIVRAATAQQILNAGENLAAGATLLIEPGTYKLDRPLVLRARQNISIRSASGDPTSVTLRGEGWETGDEHDDGIRVANCTNVSIGGLTFSDFRSYGIKVEAEHGPRGVHISNCKFRDIGIRAIKGSAGNDPNVRAVLGSVRFCDFENTKVPPANWIYNGDYIAGIDMMRLKGWTFSDNIFRNIHGRNGGGRAAIFVWVRSEEIVIERNLIVNCDRGISIGNPGVTTASESLPYCSTAVIQNNMIAGGPDCGIEVWHSTGVKILHNSIWRPEQNFNRGLRIGAGATEIIAANNLIHGGIQIEGGNLTEDNNVSGRLKDYFVNPAMGDLRLTTNAVLAIDRAARSRDEVPEAQAAQSDIRGKQRGPLPDVGAWESNPEPTD